MGDGPGIRPAHWIPLIEGQARNTKNNPRVLMINM